MIEGLKPLYERILGPAISLFVRAGIKPNHLTVAGVFLFAAAGVLCAVGMWYWAALAVTTGALLDGWDGLLARRTGTKSDFGAILDSTCDRLTEICWLAGIGVYYSRGVNPDIPAVWVCISALLGSLMVSYVKARCEGQGVACRGGLLQRSERIILVGICLFAGPRVMVAGLAVVSMLAWFTVAQRIRIAFYQTGRRIE